MKRIHPATLALAQVVALTACNQPAQPSASGVWQLQSSQIDFSYWVRGDLQYLDLSDPHTAGAYGGVAAANLKSCPKIPYHADQNSLSLKTGSSSEAVFLLSVSNDTLTLKNTSGQQATFTKVSEVPAEVKCQTISFASGPVEVHLGVKSGSNITSDGANLWLADEGGNVYQINPATGQLGTAQLLTNSGYSAIQTMQGGDFWATEFAGRISTIKRMRLGGSEQDSIDTRVDLSHELATFGAAYSTRLWLAGQNLSTDQSELLEVDSDTEPDVLVKVHPLDFYIDKLTIHQGKLWGLITLLGWNENQIVELDTANDTIARSYTLPALDEGDNYRGLTSLDGKLYLLADYGNAYAIYTVVP